MTNHEATGLLAAGVLLNAPEPFRGDDAVAALAYVRWLEAELALAQRIMLGALRADPRSLPDDCGCDGCKERRGEVSSARTCSGCVLESRLVVHGPWVPVEEGTDG